jgi:hypothetical protein
MQRASFSFVAELQAFTEVRFSVLVDFVSEVCVLASHPTPLGGIIQVSFFLTCLCGMPCVGRGSSGKSASEIGATESL